MPMVLQRERFREATLLISEAWDVSALFTILSAV